MDFLQEHWDKFWAFITVSENAGAIQTIIAVLLFVAAMIAKPWTWFNKDKGASGQSGSSSPTSPDQPIIKMTLQQFEETIAKKIAEAEAKFKTAQSEEKNQLQQQIEELRKQAANPEPALEEALKTIAKLEDALTREGNDIGGDRMAEALKALETGDFSIADDIFAEIEDREMLAVERTARAAFARGEIAEQEIRWADAAKHYARAARLHPACDNLFSARLFAWRSGDYDKAIILGTELLVAAKTEFGDSHEKYATALNEHAITLDATGKHEKAEPLYLQALEIGKQTIGEQHPSYATRLNNLAALYITTGKYEKAESLYVQAHEIDKQTIGEQHPNYAIALNNLASLYEATGKYEKAEPLYLQALEIGKQTIGEQHPDYATRLNNLANLYEAIGKYQQAEPLYKQALKIGKQTIGETHPDYAARLNNLALLYNAMGKYEQAEPLFQQAIKVLETTLGLDHPNTKVGKANYENFLKSRDK